MNEETLFFALFFVIVLTGLTIRSYYSYKVGKTQRRLSLKQRVKEMAQAEGRFFSGVYFASNFYAIGLFLLYFLFSSSLAWFQMPFPNWLRWLGVGLGLLSIPFLFWVHYSLDREWSITLKFQAYHQLITTGPYRKIRHPMYTALIIYMLSWVLVSASLLILVYYAISVLLIAVRIPREERMMPEKFGAKYRAYMKQSGRLLPRFHREERERTNGDN